ncbi:MAG: carboxylating nicotinate-nucleotide diphosphorylase [Proteobacteria bacterium]|nr:carboxylating nicotinate-nucleotide diphosphorylase [Pseudomonadota bacterium]
MINLTELMHSISQELEVDRVNDDVTVRLLGDKKNKPCRAILLSKENGVFSGEQVIAAFSGLLDGLAKIESKVREGDRLSPGQEILKISATSELCLTTERTLINYLSHLSGVATLTRQFVEAVKPHHTQILATRKTVPGLRGLQLQAVVAGGGRIHRRSLSDGILIKENHQAFAEPVSLIERAKQERSPLHRVEIEIQDFETLEKVIQNPPDVIMLDNFSESDVSLAVKKIKTNPESASCLIEVSGGMTLEKVGSIAGCGVDYISVGMITHSAPALNMSMDLKFV